MIYRPPREARTPLLQVTHGCSHNACTFCGMYKDKKYSVSDFKEIEEDLNHLKKIRPNTDRIYLLNGDPFAMETSTLLEICKMIKSYLPKITTISMYASVKNIMGKTDDDLINLRRAGVNVLYMGIETGHDGVLKEIVKGNTKEEAIRELKRLEEANYEYKAMIMLGIAGRGRARENALETADLFSKVSPRGIFCLSTTLVPGTILHDKYLKGTFKEATEYERIIETEELLKNIAPPKKVRFNSVHVSNSLVIDGFLPEDRKRLIKECRSILDNYSEEDFQKEFDRHSLRNL